MIDGLYQSVICFYFTYLQFQVANFETESGRNVNDYKRLGVYIVNPTVVVVNVYILINTYRWDWFMCLITGISIILVFFWTGVYTSFTAGYTFYGAASQVYGALSFWCVALLTVVMCLAPRFGAKAFQKMYMPLDIDIVREQVRQGKFDYLKDVNPGNVGVQQADKVPAGSTSSSEVSNGKPAGAGLEINNGGERKPMEEDMRPIYPPSIAATATTHNPRSHNGSDGTEYTGHRISTSIDRAFPHAGGPQTTNPTIQREDGGDVFGFGGTQQPPRSTRPSVDRPRPSFDRLRSSMDRTRPSFEASRDFTSAAYLSRVESSQSTGKGGSETPIQSSKRTQDISEDLRSSTGGEGKGSSR